MSSLLKCNKQQNLHLDTDKKANERARITLTPNLVLPRFYIKVVTNT